MLWLGHDTGREPSYADIAPATHPEESFFDMEITRRRR
jgi:hypothetical protein